MDDKHELDGPKTDAEGDTWAQTIAAMEAERLERVNDEHQAACDFLDAQARQAGNVAEVYLEPNGGYQARSRELRPGEEPGIQLVETPLHQPDEGSPEWTWQRADAEHEAANPFELQLNDGSYVRMTEERFRQFKELGVSPEMFLRHEQMLHEVDLVTGTLDGSDLALAFGAALKLRITDIADVARRVRESEIVDMSESDVARAQRDLAFLLGAMTVGLGARGEQEGREHGVSVRLTSFRSLGRHSYESVYRTSYETLDDEGDFSDIVGDERDWLLGDGVTYTGSFKIEVDPNKRINFSYTPDQDEAAEYYAQEMLQRKGKGQAFKTYLVSDLRVSLDVDDKAPEGLALDIGRSEFYGSNFDRPGDLMGRVMEQSTSPDVLGSHTYLGFTREMLPQFTNLAEDIIVHQHLRSKRAADEREGYRPSEAEVEGDLARYRRNEGYEDEPNESPGSSPD